MDLGLAGQPVVIIGGANGIGWAIAEAFAQEAAPVAVLDISPATLERTESLAERLRVPTFGKMVDVCQYEQLEQAAEQCAEQLGGCRHFVYAAGAGSGKYGFPFWDLAPSDWPRVLEINLQGAVNAAHAFVPHLRAGAPGSMLFIASIAGQIGSQTDPPYSAAKAGLINFAQCAAKDLAEYDVRVNTICPGMVATDINRSVWQAWRNKQPADCSTSYEAWAEDKIRRTTPLGRWQTPADVAALAVFLASPRACNITGQTMNVDGGFVMR